MNQYVEFEYETIRGQILQIQGKSDGEKVKFIAYDIDHFPVHKSKLTTIDIRNIEESILEYAEDELDFFDLDYRDER